MLQHITDKKIIITQIKSSSKTTKIQKSNLIGLGLRKIGSEVTINSSKEVVGMITKVSHLVKFKII